MNIFQVLLLIPIFLNIVERGDSQCLTCAATGFSCLSTTTYVTCNTTTLDLRFIYTCPATMVCNAARALNNPLITIPCYVAGTATSCTNTALALALPAFNASSWCLKGGVTGNFVHPTRPCSWYVKCWSYNLVITGNEYLCPGAAATGTTLFNPITRICDSTKTTCP